MCGLQSEAKQKRLLTETRLNEAAEIAQSIETVTKNAQQLKGTESRAVAQVT